jgi:hypothetical protein
LEIETPQHRECRLAVKLPDVPVFAIEDQLAGEDAVWKILADVFGELGQLLDRVGAESEI